ncbi:NlpC/P60 family protein [Cytobacillus sp. FJAT-54145]|uniref:NlpC/P60 family protein n=1 Tax=Cytobacillus spartinae TaxID=3299023 RepID=A0ABW6K515_9BACI
MRKQLLTAALTAGLLFTTFNGQASAHENTYEVKAGDTLWRISTANNITVNELMVWNKLTSSTIYAGQKLSLLAPHSHGSTYTVKSGDTLWSVAAKNNLTVTQLKSINNLNSNTIYAGQVLKLTQPTSNTTGVATSTISKVDVLIAEANKYIGVPYVWGGSTPSGFDCSGYLQYVFNRAGISIPRTVADIWKATKSVSSPKVGDIVFFTTYKAGPSHAGIYLGNNKFIHSSSSKGVTITDMNNSYWKPRYLGAKTTF